MIISLIENFQGCGNLFGPFDLSRIISRLFTILAREREGGRDEGEILSNISEMGCKKGDKVQILI